MQSQIRPALVLLGLFTVLLGVAYPLVVTGVAQAAFHDKANGSLITANGEVVGSRLIGQPFDSPKYFWSRPSATTDADGKPLAYNAGASLGSNLGPTNPALTDAVKGRIEVLHAADPLSTEPVPVDLITSSGSGLDPHVSLAAALFQVRRVARERRVDEARIRALVNEHSEGPLGGIFGENIVNVLELNRSLDELR